MTLPGGALLDPAGDERDLAIAQRPVRLGRRHDLGRVVRRDPTVQHAARQVSGPDRMGALLSLQHREGALLGIEPELRFARVGVRPVTGEAPVREDRLDVPVELDLVGEGKVGRAACGHCGDRHREQDADVPHRLSTCPEAVCPLVIAKCPRRKEPERPEARDGQGRDGLSRGARRRGRRPGLAAPVCGPFQPSSCRCRLSY